MAQTPRTPRAGDNASPDPDQDARDAGEAREDPYGDENIDPARQPAPPTTGKRGRSPNWLPCELVGASPTGDPCVDVELDRWLARASPGGTRPPFGDVPGRRLHTCCA